MMVVQEDGERKGDEEWFIVEKVPVVRGRISGDLQGFSTG